MRMSTKEKIISATQRKDKKNRQKHKVTVEEYLQRNTELIEQFRKEYQNKAKEQRIKDIINFRLYIQNAESMVSAKYEYVKSIALILFTLYLNESIRTIEISQKLMQAKEITILTLMLLIAYMFAKEKPIYPPHELRKARIKLFVLEEYFKD